jgi:outer membrane protein assembly factor BamA
MPNRKVIIFLFLCFASNIKQLSAQVIAPPVSDSTRLYTIGDLEIIGTKKTKNYIITREIIFFKGQSIAAGQLFKTLERSKNNLFNTALFNQVLITASENKSDSSVLDIRMELKERWYIIPEPVFDLYDRNYKVWSKVYNRDPGRIRYGVLFKYKNFTGRRDQLGINLLSGFDKEISFNYSQPFADHRLKQGFGINGGYIKRIGVTYNDSVNAGLPRKLCPTCATPDFKLFYSEDYYAGVNYQYRNGIYDRHIFNLIYYNSSVSDTIVRLNPDYYLNGIHKTSYIDFNYNYSFSKVDYFAYPLMGSQFFTGLKNRFSYDGLGQLLIYGIAARYVQLKKNLYFSTQLAASARFNQNEKSFYNLRTSDLANGNVRGLEEYLILSKYDVASRNSLRYKILDYNIKLPVKIKNHELVPIHLYARVFADAAYVYLPEARSSSLHNKLLKTAGFAIDLVTIYDLNWRFEFSYNQLARFSFFIR